MQYSQDNYDAICKRHAAKLPPVFAILKKSRYSRCYFYYARFPKLNCINANLFYLSSGSKGSINIKKVQCLRVTLHDVNNDPCHSDV